jgi:hypothetical protein
MGTRQPGEAEAQLSAVLKDVATGNEVAIPYGKKKETVTALGVCRTLSMYFL